MADESSEIVSVSGAVSTRFSGYRPLGGHGMMTLGTITGHGRRWFVKSLSPQYRDLSEARAMLAKEYDVMLSLRHESIVRPVAFEEIPGVGPSIIMEYVAGETLSDYLAHATWRQRRAVAKALVEAVAYLHRNGLVHGDLKPDNILVSGSVEVPKVTLIDFNLSDSSAYTEGKTIGGNRRYAAPEQFEPGYVSSPRADVWSLGLLLSEMRLGPLWTPAIRRATCPDADRRLPDASAIAALRRRSGRWVAVLAISLIVSIAALILMSLIPGREGYTSPVISMDTTAIVPAPAEAATPPAIEAAPVVSAGGAPEVGASLPAPAAEAEAASTGNSEDAKWEAAQAVLMKQAAAAIAEIRKEYAAALADPTLKTATDVTERSMEIQNKIGDTFMKLFSDFHQKCPQEVIARHPMEWAHPYNPTIKAQYDAMMADIIKLNERRNELSRQYKEQQKREAVERRQRSTHTAVPSN